MTSPAAKSRIDLAFWSGIGCFFVWGLFPYLFAAAQRAGASVGEVTAWRSLAAVPCLLLLMRVGGAGGSRVALTTPKLFLPLVLSGLLIGLNWLVYVWAVSHGQTLSASLGYYINPLLIMAAGAAFFQERMERAGLAAIVLAAAGVALQAVAVGGVPWVSITLAVSFTGYSLLRKRIPVDARTGLLVECLVLALPSLAYLGWLASRGEVRFGERWDLTLLLLAGGPATVLPLVLFAYAARRLPLTTIGFLQFLAPSMLFGAALTLGETLTPLRAASFALIWAGVAVFLGASWRRQKP